MPSDPVDELAAAARVFAEAILAAYGQPLPPRNLSVDEAASLLGVSRSTIYNRMKSGELHSLKIGSRRLIPSDELPRQGRP